MANKKQRTRSIGSISNELIKKSRESSIAAVQIFNSPAITFKSEIFIVMMIISWTYLLHAYFRKQGIEYRHYTETGSRKRFIKTSKGAYKHWELEQCLNEAKKIVDTSTSNNLKFLIGLRHEIEHQMTNRLDEHLSARFQSCCLNYNDLIKKLFGDELGIDKHLSISLQFSSIGRDQVESLKAASELPAHIRAYIDAFDEQLTDAEFNDPRFAYRVLFVPKSASRKGKTDQVIEFIRPDSELAKDANRQYAVIKEIEKKKYLPKQVVAIMQSSGYKKFKMHHHTQLWKQENAKNPGNGLGVMVVDTWHWYEEWITHVKEHCSENEVIYT